MEATHRGRQIVVAADRSAWRAWLAAHHRQPDGVWLVLARKGSDVASPTYDEAVEEALCFGWIDSVANRWDDARRLQLFSPRKPGSGWARTNKERVERLIATGLMTPAGLATIAAAEADGSWNLLDSVEALEVPEDLRVALDAVPAAAAGFAAFAPSVRKPLLQWLVTAKRAETRAKRIDAIVAGALAGRSPLTWERERSA